VEQKFGDPRILTDPAGGADPDPTSWGRTGTSLRAGIGTSANLSHVKGWLTVVHTDGRRGWDTARSWDRVISRATYASNAGNSVATAHARCTVSC
jgi:hypothetical protein